MEYADLGGSCDSDPLSGVNGEEGGRGASAGALSSGLFPWTIAMAASSSSYGSVSSRVRLATLSDVARMSAGTGGGGGGLST